MLVEIIVLSCLCGGACATEDKFLEDILDAAPTVETEKVYYSPEDTENDTTFSFSQASEISVPKKKRNCLHYLLKCLCFWRKQ